MIQLKEGNIFNSNVQTLTNTVNCVGVMGAGLAKQFKQKYPKMFKDYVNRCKNNLVKVGNPYPYYHNDLIILNFPTKRHWKDKSEYIYVTEGLDYFVQNYKKWGIESIAFPPLGCGLGGLDWNVVKEEMISKLQDINIVVEIYEPRGV